MSKSKPVRCIETGQQYPSAAEASRRTHVSCRGIEKCCMGLYLTAGGFHWEYLEETRPSTTLPSPVAVLPLGQNWGVFYQGALLKVFPFKEYAWAYASDSALEDVALHSLKRLAPRPTKAVRHLESGKIYPSAREAGEAFGVSAESIRAVIYGTRPHTQGQRFEYVE